MEYESLVNSTPGFIPIGIKKSFNNTNNMRYRIKIVTWQNGDKEYSAYVKRFFGWVGLFSDGRESLGYNYESLCSKEDAIKRIELHCNLKHKKTKVEFEYYKNINKK